MDPVAVFRLLWRHKLVAMPFLALTVVAFALALILGPRSYQATASYAMITPAVPTPQEVEQDPSLSVASNNPYLRSADPTLALQVAKTRLSSSDVIQGLQDKGLSTEFTVGAGLATSSQILTITANSADRAIAIATAVQLGVDLEDQIREIQTATGASERFLITVQPIDIPTGALEKLSSRLRNAVVVGFGAIVLLLGAVSIAEWLDRRRRGAVETEPAADDDDYVPSYDSRDDPSRGPAMPLYQPRPLPNTHRQPPIAARSSSTMHRPTPASRPTPSTQRQVPGSRRGGRDS